MPGTAIHHAAVIGPLVQDPGNKFAPAVALNAVRSTTFLHQAFDDGRDFRTGQALTSLDRQALPTKIIDYR